MPSLQILRSFALALIGVSAIPLAASADIVVTVDKSTQRMTVAVDGAQRWVWPVSTGRAGYATPSGTYKPFRMEAEHYSKEWDDAPMPHSIFFTMKGHAIHGTYDTAHLGMPVSHGCVRLSDANAAQLYALVQQQGFGAITVSLVGEASESMAAARRGVPGNDQPIVQPIAVQPAFVQPQYSALDNAMQAPAPVYDQPAPPAVRPESRPFAPSSRASRFRSSN